MKRFVLVVATTMLLLAGSGGVHAAALSFGVATPIVTQGTPVDVEVTISDLGLFSEPSLGTFDLTIGFDSAILDPMTVTFGTDLDLFGFGANVVEVSSGAGFLSVFELSFDSAPDLNVFQADAFTLFTATFATIGPGVSALAFDSVILGDALGSELDATLGVGSVEVLAAAPVPTPATLFLLLAGIAGLGLQRKHAAWRRAFAAVSRQMTVRRRSAGR